MRDVRPWARLLETRSIAPAEWTAALALVDFDGTWELRQPVLLSRLLDLGEALQAIRVSDALTGRWSLEQFDAPQLHVLAAAGADTELSVGTLWTKPPHTPLTLDLSGKFSPADGTIRRIGGELVLGKGRMSLIDGEVALTGRQDEGGSSLKAHGLLRAEKVESLLAGWQMPAAWLADLARGGAEAHASVEITEAAQRADLALDLGGLDISAGGVFCKPAGRPAKLTAAIENNGSAAAPGHQTARLALTFPGAELRIDADRDAPGDGPERLHAVFDVPDAAGLSESVPCIARRTDGGRLAGPVRIGLDATWDGGRLDFDARGDATDAEFLLAACGPRSKRAGTPLSMQLSGSLAQAGEGQINANITQVELHLAQCTLTFTGQGQLRRTGEAGLAFALPAFNADARAVALVDDGLLAMAPELARSIRGAELSGSLTATAQLHGDAAQLSMKASLEAGQLDLRQAGPFAKPAGVPASAELELTADRDLTRVQLNNLSAQAGEATLLADGTMRAGGGLGALLTASEAAEGHVSVTVRKADTLGVLLPKLATLHPTGSAFFDCQWSAGHRLRDWHLATVDLHTDGLAGRFRGKDFALRGELALEDVRQGSPWKVQIGHLRSSALKVQAGQNVAWLLADLRNLPLQPTGTADVLIADLDMKDLQDWLAGLLPPVPASEPAEPVSSPPPHLNDARAQVLRSRAQQFVAQREACWPRRTSRCGCPPTA